MSEASVDLLDATGYEFHGLVGKGAFSSVFRARSAKLDAMVAIKIMDFETISTAFEDIIQVGAKHW